MIEEPVAQSGKGERHGPWKYHLKKSTAEAELYPLDRDPSEMYNILAPNQISLIGSKRPFEQKPSIMELN